MTDYHIYINILEATDDQITTLTAQECFAIRDMVDRSDRTGRDYHRIPYGPAQEALYSEEGNHA